jgi:hypothetical protein
MCDFEPYECGEKSPVCSMCGYEFKCHLDEKCDHSSCFDCICQECEQALKKEISTEIKK